MFLQVIDVEVDRILNYDWLKEDVFVVKGRFELIDLNKLVNNIFLGFSVVIVKVDRVVNEEGFLWRLNAKKMKIGDVFYENILWYIYKIFTVIV